MWLGDFDEVNSNENITMPVKIPRALVVKSVVKVLTSRKTPKNY